MTSKKSRTVDVSVYAAAPDLLLEAIAESEAKLAGQEKSSGYAFWKSKVNMMRFALNYIEDLRYIQKNNEVLKSQVAFYMNENENLRKELLQYVVVEELIERDLLLKVVSRIEARGKLVDQEIKDKIKQLRP